MLVTLPSPIPLPLKMLQAKEHASTLCSFAVFYLDSHLSPSRSWECVISNGTKIIFTPYSKLMYFSLKYFKFFLTLYLFGFWFDFCFIL
jgi:hypothetical protein